MDKLIMKKWASSFAKIYTAAVLLYQIFWQIVPVRVFLCNTGLDMLSTLLALAGFAFLAVDIFIERTVIQSRYSICLLAAVGVMCVSSLMYIGYGWTNNAKVIIWQTVQMFLIYSLYLRMDTQQIKNYLRNMFLVVAAVFAVAVMVSIYQFVMQISYITSVDGGNCRQGFQEGRLFGVFGSIYFASLLITILGIGSVYCMLRAHKLWKKILLGIQAALFFIYIVLSGTRSILVGILCGVIICSVIITRSIISRKKFSSSVWKSILCITSAAAVCVVIAYGAYDGSHKLLSRIPEWAGTENAEGNGGEDISSSLTDDVLERPDIKGDISNNRFKIWGDYISCTLPHIKSALFGYSPGNYMEIIKQEYPDKYIVQYIRDNYPLMFSLNRIYDTHNGYLAVFAGSGLLGIIAMGAFLILFGLRTLKYFIKNKRVSGFSVLVVTALAVILTSVFFDSDLFYKCTSTSVMFWMLAGFMMKITDGPDYISKPEETKE